MLVTELLVQQMQQILEQVFLFCHESCKGILSSFLALNYGFCSLLSSAGRHPQLSTNPKKNEALFGYNVKKKKKIRELIYPSFYMVM